MSIFDEVERHIGRYAVGYLGDLPSHMRDGAAEYLLRGRPTGDFLRAVFENNLMEAFIRADGANQMAMMAWAMFLHNVMPVTPVRSFGSKKDYENWIKIGGLHGLVDRSKAHILEEDAKSSQGM